MVKLILLASPRSGTNWLESLMTSRSDVRMDGEILDNPHMRIYPDFAKDPIAGIYGDLWAPSDHAVCGFKLFYFNCRAAHKEKGYVWQVFQQDRSIKVICLTRENLLRMLISWDMATQTNIWSITEPAQDSRLALLLDPGDVLSRLRDIRNGMSRARGVFSAHDVYDVTYEGLLASTMEHCDAIQDFLGLKRQPLKSPLARMETRLISQIVANYEDICAALRGTEFEWMLEG